MLQLLHVPCTCMLQLLHVSSAPVFIAFFTLAGMCLKLDSLATNLPLASFVFMLRLGAQHEM